MYRVKDIMTSTFVSARPDTTIDEAISLLLEHRVSGLPVVDANGQLLGVLSEFDIIDLVYTADIETSTAGEHMTRDVHCIEAEVSLDDAAGMFCTESVRRIPVLRDGKVVGILSRRDLIRFIRDVRKQSAHH